MTHQPLRYPWVVGTLGIAAVTGICLLTPAAFIAPWIAGSWSVLMAGRSAWGMLRRLRSGTWGTDILAVAAILSTLALGDYWASLVVVLMLTGGSALENFATARAERELAALSDRNPTSAHRKVGDQFTLVPVQELTVGDIIRVLPGELVPVDGELMGENATVDESSLTGESLPQLRHEGDTILSGSVNGGGVQQLSVLRIAADSEYQNIVKLVARASQSKAPVVRLADRFAIPFTVTAFVIAAVAWAVSGDPRRFAEVLVVATPCSLLIAAPVAFVAGMSRAAAAGVIVKLAGVLEVLSRVATVAFDKTGTLTEGTPQFLRVDTVRGEQSDVLTVAASLEVDSPHVLARAVVAAAQARDLPVATAQGVDDTPGKGLRGVLRDGRTATVGRSDFVSADDATEWPELLAGEMAIYVGVGGAMLGRIVLVDETRPNAAEAIARLRALRPIDVVMLTGDAAATAALVGERTRITDIRAALLPAQKVAELASITRRPVAMVGDGVNDAPVLAAADVGIAMGARGATAASESADVVIMVNDIMKVADIVAIAQRTVRIALQSIWIGVGLSLVLMIIASTGVIPAIVGAALQEVVDVITILNALRAARQDGRTAGAPAAAE